MTQEEQLDVIRKHYDLNGAGEYKAAAELVTEDFVITIPPYMPFGGVYRGKGAFRELIPLVREAVAIAGIRPVTTTLGPDSAVEIVEFTFAGEDKATTQVAELIRFRGNQICEIRPYYNDPNPFLASAQGRRRA